MSDCPIADRKDAVAKLKLISYDVVALDRDLPGIHGDIVCRMITDGENPAMILMLTVAALARRKTPTHDRILRVAGIELDPLAGTVTRDGRVIDVTAKERAVLEALLRAGPGALSAETLLERAWDENVDPFTETVKVTIARLRRKLGEPDVIHNTPGVGYRISSEP